jgi:hypothetical protein
MTAPVPADTDDQSPASQDTPTPEAEGAVAAEAGTDAPISEVPVSDEAAAGDADAVTVPVKALPDRADAPVSEVAERFLRAVIAEVPVDLIEELHLFSPLRQGTVETGIAVLAVRVPVAIAAESEGEPELPFAEEGADADGEMGTAEALEAEALEAEALTAEALTAEALEAEALEAEALTAENEEAALEADADDEPLGDGVMMLDGEGALDTHYVVAAEGDDDEDVSVTDDIIAEASADESDEADAVIELPPVKAARPVRHTVYTARYRYVIKGPERGKWESSIKAEADAPLITVETVVRGVQRRAGEESEIVRYSGAQIAKALRIPYTA